LILIFDLIYAARDEADYQRLYYCRPHWGCFIRWQTMLLNMQTMLLYLYSL
jgi:hypothetical protein